MTEPRIAMSAVLLACAFACTTASAQLVIPPSAAASAAERAQKETDRTMYWIRVLASKPAPAKAQPAVAVVTTASPRPVAAVATVSARPAEAPREKIKVAAATPAVGDAPVPARVTRGLDTTQPPVSDASYPSALSSSTADDVAAATPLPPVEVAPPPVEEPDPGLVQVKSVQPEFPENIVRRVHKGNVEVRFEVDPAGTVVDAAVVESSHTRLNEAAIEAIMQWRFKPTPKTHTAMVNLVFDIDNEK